MIKIGDFGECIFVGDSFPLENVKCGTKEYSSPELDYGKQHDFKTDVW